MQEIYKYGEEPTYKEKKIFNKYIVDERVKYDKINERYNYYFIVDMTEDEVEDLVLKLNAPLLSDISNWNVSSCVNENDDDEDTEYLIPLF